MKFTVSNVARPLSEAEAEPFAPPDDIEDLEQVDFIRPVACWNLLLAWLFCDRMKGLLNWEATVLDVIVHLGSTQNSTRCPFAMNRGIHQVACKS